MNITTHISITKSKTGDILYNDEKKKITLTIHPSDPLYELWKNFYYLFPSRREELRENVYNDVLTNDASFTEIKKAIEPNSATTEPIENTPIDPKEELTKTLTKIIDFFKEFEFEPNYRFINTLAYKAKEKCENALEYIRNYFALMDNSYKSEINSKCKSKEFKEIIKNLKAYSKPTSHINQRFVIYYGSAGTGKTTLAMNESNGKCIVCNSSMLPSDLMEDFVFNNGQPTFQKSSLWDCMENGTTIVLDEINLLPFDSLRFLQGILDGKKEFDYKGHQVTIADGFKVIGTMNLSIGGMVYGLPEPLIDRCADMRQFSLSANQLLSAIF